LRTIGAAIVETDPDAPNADLVETVETASRTALPRSDALFEPCDIPDKWLRLDFQCPLFSFNPNAAANELAALATHAAAETTRSIREQLQRWALSEEGGQRWGYRRGVRVLPSDYGRWASVLHTARTSNASLA